MSSIPSLKQPDKYTSVREVPMLGVGGGGVLCWSELKFFSMSSVRSPNSVGWGLGGGVFCIPTQNTAYSVGF